MNERGFTRFPKNCNRLAYFLNGRQPHSRRIHTRHEPDDAVIPSCAFDGRDDIPKGEPPFSPE